MTKEELFKMALEVRKNAYAPYSNFLVGCALVTRSGKTYSGCNFENISFGATICAERNAVGSAIAAGETGESSQKEFIETVVIVSQTENPAPPCGMCLQVLSEFCTPDTQIHLANLNGIVKTENFQSFLPHQFKTIT